MVNVTGKEALSSNELNSNISEASRENYTCSDRYQVGVYNANFTTATKHSYILAIIINSTTCPCTVLLNILVIIAVTRTRRLQNSTNIVLACLAVTDALNGLLLQPSFVIWKAFQLNAIDNQCLVRTIHNWLFALISLVSLLHLTLVTAERLIAIRFSLRYLSIVTSRKILTAVGIIWIFGLLIRVGLDLASGAAMERFFVFVVVSCILFILVTYAILIREIIRHHQAIQTQQQSQEERERFSREKRIFKTMVFVFGALLISFVPMALAVAFRPRTGYSGLYDVLLPWARTFAMLNSFFNPLIYCWRQKEMRNAVFRISVAPSLS